MYPLHTRVVLTSNGERGGSIVGYSVITRDRFIEPVYVVQLDNGFYSDDRQTYVSLLIVHGDNLRRE